jgi:hypothetical protein
LKTNEQKVNERIKDTLTVKQLIDQLSKYPMDAVVLFRLDGCPDPYRYPLWPVHGVSELDYGADVPAVDGDCDEHFHLRSYSVAAHEKLPELDDPWSGDCVMIHTHY